MTQKWKVKFKISEMPMSLQGFSYYTQDKEYIYYEPMEFQTELDYVEAIAAYYIQEATLDNNPSIIRDLHLPDLVEDGVKYTKRAVFRKAMERFRGESNFDSVRGILKAAFS